jgi:hypothetical protein
MSFSARFLDSLTNGGVVFLLRRTDERGINCSIGNSIPRKGFHGSRGAAGGEGGGRGEEKEKEDKQMEK